MLTRVSSLRYKVPIHRYCGFWKISFQSAELVIPYGRPLASVMKILSWVVRAQVVLMTAGYSSDQSWLHNSSSATIPKSYGECTMTLDLTKESEPRASKRFPTTAKKGLREIR